LYSAQQDAKSENKTFFDVMEKRVKFVTSLFRRRRKKFRCLCSYV
jgi:hypothetical protein